MNAHATNSVETEWEKNRKLEMYFYLPSPPPFNLGLFDYGESCFKSVSSMQCVWK